MCKDIVFRFGSIRQTQAQHEWPAAHESGSRLARHVVRAITIVAAPVCAARGIELPRIGKMRLSKAPGMDPFATASEAPTVLTEEGSMAARQDSSVGLASQVQHAIIFVRIEQDADVLINH